MFDRLVWVWPHWLKNTSSPFYGDHMTGMVHLGIFNYTEEESKESLDGICLCIREVSQRLGFLKFLFSDCRLFICNPKWSPFSTGKTEVFCPKAGFSWADIFIVLWAGTEVVSHCLPLLVVNHGDLNPCERLGVRCLVNAHIKTMTRLTMRLEPAVANFNSRIFTI